MRLTQFTDYAVRTLIYLGLKGQEQSTIGAIAEAYGISRYHLMKVANRLQHMGYVKSVRGRGGGVRLGMDPTSIGIGTLIRRTEGDLAPVECFRSDNRCVISPSCGFQHVFGNALHAFLAELDRHTLADLLPSVDQRDFVASPDAAGQSPAPGAADRTTP
jgi:Rrf2 family transcriptional regulator, nitric oxide-sensitive transcriptional repressor